MTSEARNEGSLRRLVRRVLCRARHLIEGEYIRTDDPRLEHDKEGHRCKTCGKQYYWVGP